jgi:glycosyltransferase involved in cell wall biosynthesis
MSDEIFINGRFLTQKLTGVQRNAYELSRHLIPLLKQAIVLVPNEKINKNYDINDWPIRKLGKFKGILWEQIELPLFLLKQKGKPLLLNLTNTAPLQYSNQVVSIMDMTTFINPSWFTKKFSYYYQWLIPKIARKSKMIFTISNNSRNDIVRFTQLPADKIKVLYCGISDIFSPAASFDTGIVSSLGLKDQGYFMAVSSLDPRKNFKGLIDAFLETTIDLPLLIVGSKGRVFGDINLHQPALNSKRIVFTGYVNDEKLRVLYKSAFCFIYPSLYEGFGIPPLEAMASGCPTIVSNTSSLPEVCGQASLYIDPYNKQSIIDGIMKMFQNNSMRNDLIEKGFENIKRFSWEATASKALTEIQKIV